MKREHIILVFLALFAGLVTFSPAVSPKFGDIPNPNGMNYGWDGTNNVARSMAVDADGNAQIELNNASTTPANVVLRDGTSGAQIGTTSNPLDVDGTVTAQNQVYVGSTPTAEQAKYSRIQSSTSAKSDSIATNAATLISSIASITPPCSVQISCPAGQLWYAPGLATTTLASMKYHVLDEYQSVVFNVSTSTWDCSVAGVSAVSSCSVTVHSLVQ